MKTKIFVFSSSGLDYISHVPQITVIPDVITSMYNEDYYEGNELTPLQHYERLRNDKYYNPTISTVDSDYVNELIDTALANSYDRFVFFINDNDIVNYSPCVSKISEERRELDITILRINALSYPLAHLVIEVEKKLRANENLDEIISFVNSYRNSFKIYFYAPKENVLPSVKRIDFDDDVIASSTYGKVFLYDGNLIELKKDIKESNLEMLLNNYVNDVKDSKVIPFLLYTNKYSLYNEVLERKLLSIYPRIKSIKSFQVPIMLGSKVGNNAIGIGFVKKINE